MAENEIGAASSPQCMCRLRRSPPPEASTSSRGTIGWRCSDDYVRIGRLTVWDGLSRYATTLLKLDKAFSGFDFDDI